MKKTVYTIIGQDELLVKEKINQILQINSINWEKSQFLYLEISNEDDQQKKILQELSLNNFFFNKIIVITANNLESTKIKEKKIILDALQKTKNWVFLIVEKKLSINLNKKMTEISNIIQISKVTNIRKTKFIIQLLEQNHITYQEEVIKYLEKILPNNLMIVQKEINKIIEYNKIKPQVLNLKTCQKIINRYSTGTIFPLIEGLLENNQKKIITSYQKLNQENINPLVLIATLQTYLFLIKKIEVLSKKGLKFNQIVQKLKKSNFFIMNLIKIKERTNGVKLDLLIRKIYNLEYNVKVSGISEKTLLELFLINKQDGKISIY